MIKNFFEYIVTFIKGIGFLFDKIGPFFRTIYTTIQMFLGLYFELPVWFLALALLTINAAIAWIVLEII